MLMVAEFVVFLCFSAVLVLANQYPSYGSPRYPPPPSIPSYSSQEDEMLRRSNDSSSPIPVSYHGRERERENRPFQQQGVEERGSINHNNNVPYPFYPPPPPPPSTVSSRFSEQEQQPPFHYYDNRQVSGQQLSSLPPPPPPSTFSRGKEFFHFFSSVCCFSCRCFFVVSILPPSKIIILTTLLSSATTAVSATVAARERFLFKVNPSVDLLSFLSLKFLFLLSDHRPLLPLLSFLRIKDSLSAAGSVVLNSINDLSLPAVSYPSGDHNEQSSYYPADPRYQQQQEYYPQHPQQRERRGYVPPSRPFIPPPPPPSSEHLSHNIDYRPADHQQQYHPLSTFSSHQQQETVSVLNQRQQPAFSPDQQSPHPSSSEHHPVSSVAPPTPVLESSTTHFISPVIDPSQMVSPDPQVFVHEGESIVMIMKPKEFSR
jgi:hypothetical protein